MSNSCVETPDAPEWLSKLEERREKLKKSRLGHEAGLGAPCDCEKCPGLDLHFWRKTCRICKCRKDQHHCDDDTGWAQFEILGAIRSKPAYIKIKALASQPVQLEWVPPNVAPDIASDYMDKLGTDNVPVKGSEAAAKRKQQLEFQVPPHDLDAGLCDNLSEAETNQLQQYVQKIKDNCVGQGNVVRVGNYGNAMLVNSSICNNIDQMPQLDKRKYLDVMEQLQESPVDDPILCTLLANEKLGKAICEQPSCDYPKIFIAFTEPISEGPLSAAAMTLSSVTKQKLGGLNEAAVKSVIQNGVIYDKIFGILKDKKFDVSRDPCLGPLSDLRTEYINNPRVHEELEALLQHSPLNSNLAVTPYNSPLKNPAQNFAFNSPLPLKYPAKLKNSAQLMQQETPIRKVKFGNVSQVIYDCNLPTNVDYERDPVFANIINSPSLKSAIQNVQNGLKHEPVNINCLPLPSSSNRSMDILNDDAAAKMLSAKTKQKLQTLGLTRKDMLQSAILNAPFYDRLFADLRAKQINYATCRQLQPIEALANELAKDKQMYDEVREYVTTGLQNSLDVAYAPVNMNLQKALSISKSTDSGFDSKPSTPIHHYGESAVGGGANRALHYDDINAQMGKYATIPGIQDMYMYPMVEGQKPLINTMQNMSIRDETGQQAAVNTIKCRDCLQSIDFGEVAVKAERAGKEIAWHPECFKCHQCRELLADLVYFFHGGQVYCGRDLAEKLKIPRCKACDELIFTKEYTAAEGSTFHIKHFCCYHCDSPLAGQQYIPDEKSNMPLCLKCYDEYFAAACKRCLKQIGPADQGVAFGEQHWHGSCFVCAGKDCEKSLIGGRFCVKQDMPFCSPTCVRSVVN